MTINLVNSQEQKVETEKNRAVARILEEGVDKCLYEAPNTKHVDIQIK